MKVNQEDMLSWGLIGSEDAGMIKFAPMVWGSLSSAINIAGDLYWSCGSENVITVECNSLMSIEPNYSLLSLPLFWTGLSIFPSLAFQCKALYLLQWMLLDRFAPIFNFASIISPKA